MISQCSQVLLRNVEGVGINGISMELDLSFRTQLPIRVEKLRCAVRDMHCVLLSSFFQSGSGFAILSKYQVPRHEGAHDGCCYFTSMDATATTELILDLKLPRDGSQYFDHCIRQNYCPFSVIRCGSRPSNQDFVAVSNRLYLPGAPNTDCSPVDRSEDRIYQVHQLVGPDPCAEFCPTLYVHLHDRALGEGIVSSHMPLLRFLF
mmetsp:Transcript_31609/g.49520  ORF Transcript_31609/g.49520 Transcript_31609/m.49520 type:complete len:205 (-) Transcript_31609:541-1155(-)